MSVIVRLGLIASWLACVPFTSAQQPASRKNAIADTATAARALRLYLSPIRVDSGYRLTPNSYSGATHVEQNIVFGSRPDSGVYVAPVVGVPSRAIDTWNGVQFVSPPIPGPLELSAIFSGHLDFITNQKAFDFQISVFEVTSAGEYVLLATNALHWSNPGDSSGTSMPPRARQSLDFRSDNPAKAVIRDGSRLVALITILKSADPIELLQISWYGESYIQLKTPNR